MFIILKKLLLILLIFPLWAFAIDDSVLNIDSITGEEWQAQGITLQMQGVDNTKLTLNIFALHLPTLKKSLNKIKIKCPKLKVDIEKITCKNGSLGIKEVLGKSIANFSFSYMMLSQAIHFVSNKISLFNGHLNIKVIFKPDDWQVTLTGRNIAMNTLVTRLKLFMDLPESFVNLTQQFDFEGNIFAKVQFSGKTDLENIKIDGQVKNFQFASADGLQAGENIMANLELSIKPIGESWKTSGTVTLTQAEVLNNAIYVNIGNKPLTVIMDMTWLSDRDILEIKRFDYEHKNVLNFQLYGNFDFSKDFTVKTLSFDLPSTPLSPFYHYYLSAWAEENTGALIMNGNLSVQFKQKNEKIQCTANIENTNIEDKKKRFGISGLNGKIHWRSQANDLLTHLYWKGGFLASDIILGRSAISLNLSGKRIKLLKTFHQPILDGGIEIKEFNLDFNDFDKTNMEWNLSGFLQPISMQAITKSLELPTLNGQISGTIPLIRYHNQYLDIGNSELLLNIFDGNVIISTLTLKNPFGTVPVLTADIDVDKINLETLTDITDFGKIQGELSGKINDLRMINWKPVAFSAYFATPKDNRLPRKISQKAIQNLSELGGGAARVVTGLLKVFENFSYKRIGWGCRLENGICEMRGAEPFGDGGYYIVKGGGLPRINIIGYNQQVDWRILLNRLKRVMNFSTGSPVIQ